MANIDILGSPTVCDRHIVVRNCGIYILGWTIVSGDLSWDEEKNDIDGGLSFRRDMVKISNCYETLQNIAKRENRDLADVVFLDRTTFGMTSPSSDVTSMVTGLLSIICGLYEVQASAVLREKSVVEAQ